MKRSAPISFAGSELGEERHVCAFFNDDDEEYRVLLPFMKDGFECGDKAVHVVNPDQHDGHLQRLAAVGIDAAAAQRSGQFELRTNTETYLRDGRFDQPAATPRVDFRSVALSAVWTGRPKANRTSTISSNSSRG
jgi:hypothetical protein